MGTYIETKIVALTSQSATIKFNSDFLSNVRYNLGSIYNNDDSIVHKQIQLLNAQLPYSFYVVNYTNNILIIKKDTDVLFTTITIPVGNYNGNSLITALTTLLNSIGITVQIVLSSINGKLTFVTVGYDIIISSDSTCLEILGFKRNTTYTSTSNILTAPYLLNLLGIKTLQIRSTNLLMSNISSVQGGHTTLLSTIPVDCVPFGMMDYSDKGNHLITIQNDSLDDIDLDIVDGESGQYINFNNQDWCITLAFHITRSLEPIERTKISTLYNTRPTESNMSSAESKMPSAEETIDRNRQTVDSLPKASLVPKAGRLPDSLVAKINKRDLEELNTLTQ